MSDTPRVVIIVFMCMKRANNLEGGVTDVDMACGSADKYTIGTRSYSSYVCTLLNVRFREACDSWIKLVGRDRTSKSGREGVLSTSSGALTGVTVKKLKDFHYVYGLATVGAFTSKK
jgi:hypothetical protein